MLDWIKRKRKNEIPVLNTDIHSHLLPGLDDGVKSFEEAVEILWSFVDMGYKKVITTPHIMQDYYKNDPETIKKKYKELAGLVKDNNIPIEVEVAAEYYFDESFCQMIENGSEVLTFGNKFLLFETNFFTAPLNLNEFIFSATVKGFKLVLAHPERYQYFLQDMVMAEDLINRGIFFQININSLAGHYGKPIQKLAHKLIDRGWVHFLGSDCHHVNHVGIMKEARETVFYRKACNLDLYNQTL